jgi:hypothetical protein
MSLAHPPSADIPASLAAVRGRLAAAVKEAGRAGAPVIVAVSKQIGEEKIRAALAAGQRVFAENRVQEAAAKWPALRREFPDVELRLIGPLQSNKVRDACALFDVIESLDREKLARALADEGVRRVAAPRVLIQVNTGEEPQKSGVLPAEVDRFVAYCRNLGLAPEGLMCLPPADEPPAPHFALLGKIARRNDLEFLSMGMSSDYDVAAALGATHVRIGTAIFGRRGD